MIQSLNSVDDLQNKVLKQKGLFFITLFADWCRPCRIMKPTVQSLSALLNDKYIFFSVDTEKHEEVADFFSYEGVPTFIIIKNGRETARIQGYHTKDKMLDQLLHIYEENREV